MLFVTVRRAVVLLITTGILCLSTICQAAAPADQPVVAPPLPGDELADQPSSQADLGPLDQFARDTQLASDSPILRLARVPNMFGDVFFPGGQLSVVGGGTPALMDIPLAGGSRRYKVSENNKAVPMDRYYFMYNHFHNALEADPNTAVPGLERQYSIERYIVGFERRFFDGNWSVEVRMPFCSEYGMSVPKFDVAGGDIGNLSVSLKRLLAVSCTSSLVGGLAVDTPTGSDVTGRSITTTYRVRNEAVFLSPYVGFLSWPNGRLFYQGFLQVDVAANGSPIDYNDTTAAVTGRFGKLTEQTLLHADFSTGYWLYRNPCSHTITALASVVEFHYTTTLEDASLVSGTSTFNTFLFGNLLNRVDFVNLTVGLYGELAGAWRLRAAGVFPLQSGTDRPFDSEVQFSVNRQF